MKKKLLLMMVLFSMVLTITACGGKKESANDSSKDNTLVVYSPNSEGIVNTLIPAFEEETGIKVELQQAGTGELFAKLKGEQADPVCDVMWGSSYSLYYENKDLFEEYVSTNNDDILPEYQHSDVVPASEKLDGSCIIVNKDLIGDIKIEGYEDLLNPALKGKIATADPASSSSAFSHLTNMLKVMGGYESDEAWNYVKALFTNIDGKIQSSSSSVYKTVADGEMTVGISYEDPVMQLIKDGATNVEIVYMKEGVVYLPSVTGIVKNAKHEENAKKFIDFLTSKTAQDLLGQETTNRPTRKDAATNEYMKPFQEINVQVEDYKYVTEHSEEIIQRYKDIFSEIQGQ